MLARMLKQPLLHFVVFGALIFVAYALTNAPRAEFVEDDARLIVVDRAALIDYLQYQAQTFDPDSFAARYEEMGASEREALAAAYVREEALYREGLRMNLDSADYDIRTRIVQKVEFLLEGLVANEIEPTEAEMQAFYDARRADYVQDAVYTFTHIFFDGQDDMDAARARADALLATSDSIAFEDAAQHGDRYPFLQNYVERTGSFVASNFSAAFVAQLDALTPAERWQGPLQSRNGWHLVMLRARSEASTLAFEDIRQRVFDDYRLASLARSRADAEQRVIAEYDVALELE
ncbi:MAG: peptidylprolyl isomerase [Pseudomonadota bacterium]|nr:peptidylprolyl isomerase [Pseudomonadota bacterium]